MIQLRIPRLLVLPYVSCPLDRLRVVLIHDVVLRVAPGLIGQPIVAQRKNLQVQARRDVSLDARLTPEFRSLLPVIVLSVHAAQMPNRTTFTQTSHTAAIAFRICKPSRWRKTLGPARAAGARLPNCSSRELGTGKRRFEFPCMVHPLLARSEFRGPALTAVSAVFKRLCHELQLDQRQDALTDIVAETVLQCVRDGQSDPAHILNCARRALHIQSRDHDTHPQSDP
jgi:hypothetical protein